MPIRRLHHHLRRAFAGSPDPEPADFEAMARRALDAIPDPFRRHLDNVAFRVEEFADPDTLGGLGINSRWGLLGLYHGIPVGQKEAGYIAPPADLIFLYRRPILRFARDMGETVQQVVQHVVVHEVGHHFGLSDADMERIENEA
jgi:predicted Zn-dependent protease with MMP-like domain